MNRPKRYDYEADVHGYMDYVRELQAYATYLENKTKKIEEDYILMPKRLTAENGAKALLIGEFHEVIEVGANDEQLKIPVSWDNIKKIYSMAVEHLSK